MPSPAGCHRPAWTLNGYEESNEGSGPRKAVRDLAGEAGERGRRTCGLLWCQFLTVPRCADITLLRGRPLTGSEGSDPSVSAIFPRSGAISTARLLGVGDQSPRLGPFEVTPR